MSPKNLYSLYARLTGHTKKLAAVAISTDGHLLASAGEYLFNSVSADKRSLMLGVFTMLTLGMDRIRLWDLNEKSELPTPERGYTLRGPPTCVVWAKRHEGQHDILVFGTALGFLVIWSPAGDQVRID
jgi:WD40 repeat protein